MQLAAIAAAGACCVGLALALLAPSEEPASAGDRTRRGPPRFLRLTQARIEERGGGTTLVVRGETNLVAGARLNVAVRARGQEVLRLATTSDGRAFAIEAPATGEVVEGSYEVATTFRLVEQDPVVTEALGYQPASLADRRALALPLRLARAAEAKEQVRDVLDAVNHAPRDPAALDALDRRLRELAGRLWIGEQRTALVRLRQAVDELRRPDPRRRELDRLVLEAHLLAGL